MTEPESTGSGGEGEADAGPDEPAVDETGREMDRGSGTVDGELLDRVDALDTETIAREIATLELEVETLEEELAERDEDLEELESKLKRKQADFENYKKRVQQRTEEEQRRATEGLLERFLSVRDNLQRAVEQDEDVDIRDGVESTLRQFDDVLEAEGVERIEPEPGADVDPHRHEVLARVEADLPTDAIAEVHRPGYAMGESVLREAQVTVSDGSAAEAAGEEEEADDEAE